MKCFYDPTQDAVGTCKSCGKGLSLNYLIDMEKGLACRGHCEDDVFTLITMIAQNAATAAAAEQAVKRGSSLSYGAGAFSLLMGIAFLVSGYQGSEIGFSFYLGVIFLMFGSWTLFKTYRYASVIANSSNSRTQSQIAEDVAKRPNI